MNRYDFLKTFNQVTREMDTVFNSVMKSLDEKVKNKVFSDVSFGRKYPKINVFDDPEFVLVEALVPGLDPDRLELSVHDNVLTLQGERTLLRSETAGRSEGDKPASEKFVRRVELPEEIHADRVEAEYKNGVLTVKLPKQREPSTRIHVKVA